MISRKREVVEGWQTPHFDRNVFLNDFINKLTLPVHLEISIESKIGKKCSNFGKKSTFRSVFLGIS